MTKPRGTLASFPIGSHRAALTKSRWSRKANLLVKSTRSQAIKKYIRVAKGRFHADPPQNGCGVLLQTKSIYQWNWANNELGFDPIEFGKLALQKDGRGLVKPCLHCFPACKP